MPVATYTAVHFLPGSISSLDRVSSCSQLLCVRTIVQNEPVAASTSNFFLLCCPFLEARLILLVMIFLLLSY